MTAQQWHDTAIVAVMAVVMAAILAGAILRERVREIRIAKEMDRAPRAWDGRDDGPHEPVPVPPTAKLGYWVIAGADLLLALRRVAAGESPDLVYAELYANTDREVQE